MAVIIIIGLVGLAVLLSVLLPDAADGEVRSSPGYRLRKIEDRIEEIENKVDSITK